MYTFTLSPEAQPPFWAAAFAQGDTEAALLLALRRFFPVAQIFSISGRHKSQYWRWFQSPAGNRRLSRRCRFFGRQTAAPFDQ
jgi:hypothetical protein